MDDKEKIPYNIEITFHSEWDESGQVTKVNLYEDILGYQVGSDVIAVAKKDGETVIYPMSSIAFVRHFPAPQSAE